MNRISSLFSCYAFGFFGASLSMVSGQEPGPDVSAEVWSYDIPNELSAKSAFERWRSRNPAEAPKLLALDGLSIPVREESTMVRVSGVLTAPVTGHYAFTIHAPGLRRSDRPDETELWIRDDETGEWKLAQCTGNPVKIGGRTRLEAGVPRRFELWTMGSNQTVVDWQVTDFAKTDPATGRATEVLARQTIPATAMDSQKTTADADGEGDRVKDEIGPDGPWGDPDGDGFPNWSERAAGTDPKVADVEGRKGLVRWELWRDIPGRYVFDLRRAGHFPTGPREVRHLDRLEIPAGVGDRCGSRLRGWLVAPADGEYRIGISAEDGAELWLGANDSWQSKRLIAKADQHVSGRLRWFHRNDKGENVPLESAQTAKVTLKAGERYYLEVLHKQDTGPDHCFVAWIKPGAEKPEVITREYLISWQPCPTDTDDDGLPDDWQRSSKLTDLSVSAAARHCEADADGDGVSNRDEWLAQTDPLDSKSIPTKGDMLTSEAWTGIPGRSVSSLTRHERYPRQPDVTTHIDNLDFSREGNRYGVRLRGFLTPPADGDYHFSIAGNNACVLYLAESEDKFTKRPVGRVEVGTKWRHFAEISPQRTGPFQLAKGKSYYVEVIFKRDENENHEDDHSSVAWVLPGQKNPSVIASDFFSPYRPDPRDSDDDDLPDDWERTHHLDPSISGREHGSWGDPDGDGLENFREFQLGLDPRRVDVHGTPGLALWELWDNRGDILPAVREDGGLLPDLIKRDERFPLEPTDREWRDSLESPRRQGNDFGARLRAQIVAPVSGDYVFSLAARDIGELFLSTDASKFNRTRIASVQHGTAFRSWDRRPGQMSVPIRLEAGRAYYLEALFSRGGFQYSDDFLSVAWKPPGAETFEVIGAPNLVAFFRDPNDQDDDELPDDWEKRYGLNAADPHGNQGPDGDPDRDGLTNMREYRQGSDPLNGDTDGDGVTDHDEIHVYGSDPLVKDVVPPVEHHRFRLVNGTWQGGGSWVLDDQGALTSGYRRGTLVFEFHVDAPGIYALALEAGSVGTLPYLPAVPVTVSVNRTILGHAEFPARSVTRKWLTPWLPVGKHTVTVENRNVRANVNLRILSLSLARFENGDPRTGIPEWLAKLLTSRNEVRASAKTSKVSPWFVEGTCRYPASVSITNDGDAVPVSDNLANRWHADIPLPPDGSAATVAFDFENGAVTANHEVTWTTTNLIEAPATSHLRVGDSIRVTAHRNPDDHFSLRMGDRIWEKQSASVPITLTFDKPGAHVLNATLQGGEKITTTWHVHRADFGEPFTLISGASRVWTPPDIRPPLEVRADSSIHITPLDGNGAGDKPLSFRLRLDSTVAGPLAMVARLPDDGPIVASGTVNALRLSAASKTGDAHVIGTLPDGTRVVEVSYIIDGPIPADLSIWIRLYVTDAVFTNGLTWLHLTAADFDENGVARFRVLKAPGTGTPYVCHWIMPYADFEDVLNLRPAE